MLKAIMMTCLIIIPIYDTLHWYTYNKCFRSFYLRIRESFFKYIQLKKIKADFTKICTQPLIFIHKSTYFWILSLYILELLNAKKKPRASHLCCILFT